MTHPPFNRRLFLAGSAAMFGLHGAPVWATGKQQPAYDIVVYGGSSAGVIAAVQASRLGKRTIIVNPYGFLGGMTASGLSAIDLGNAKAVSGLTRQFFTGIGKQYGVDFSNTRVDKMRAANGRMVEFANFSCEPHVAERAFEAAVQHARVPVVHELLDRERGVVMDKGRIERIRMLSGQEISGRMFIDATYEGDLMAAAKVTFTVGRESNAAYGETINGVIMPNSIAPADLVHVSDFGGDDQFTRDVDPFLRAGDRSSGLLPGVSATSRRQGEGDNRLQAYNYRLSLSSDPSNQMPFIRPDGYREIDYELLLRNFEAGDTRLPGLMVDVPNRKCDWNSSGPVGNDLAGGSQGYPEASYEERKQIEKAHELYIKGHFWTLANHPRVIPAVRTQMAKLGYSRDEFQRNGGFPYMIYVREARRMVSDYVMTEHDCRHQVAAQDPIMLASYAMDSHVTQYVLTGRGTVSREGVFFKLIPGPYGVSYRSIVPKRGEASNLLVPICLSASHAAYASIRMEPVYMGIGQVCATAAAMAIDHKCDVQQVPYDALSARLVRDGVLFNWNSETRGHDKRAVHSKQR